MQRFTCALVFMLLASTAHAQTAPQQLDGGQYNAIAPALSTGQSVTLQTDSSGRLLVDAAEQAAPGKTFVTASAIGTTAATTATLPGAAGKTTYLCGFSIRAAATALVVGNATVTGMLGGTLNFTQVTLASTVGVGVVEPPLGHQCIPASAVNTAIAVNSAAPGTGGAVSVAAWGFQQ